MPHVKMTKNLDPTGRLVIPKEILFTCDIFHGHSIEFFADEKTGTLLLQRYYGQSCHFCLSTEELVGFKGSLICKNCNYMLKTESMRVQVFQPREIMAQLLLDLYESHPHATQQQYAGMLGISEARISQLIQQVFDQASAHLEK
ncbi:AbrB/MazE/SpoVT family DNA-binding domain-containing protein [Paenibacillus sp. FSL R10-2782]|uniref:AbrB/MazE/SpoVT family DNA-binding domain-containing protein n=1 Tax=Paenibacillus sp. FSL R10-2782 TaxID=2954661 RepID=UPI00315850E7